jgi:transcriptional regulator with XRE-family HTH domain
MQREVAALGRSRKPAVPSPADGKPTRFVAKGLRSLRTRLGLSAEELGALAGVSGQSVRNWAARKSTPGKEHRAALFGLRSIGKRDARARLSQVVTKPAKKPVARKK